MVKILAALSILNSSGATKKVVALVVAALVTALAVGCGIDAVDDRVAGLWRAGGLTVDFKFFLMGFFMMVNL